MDQINPLNGHRQKGESNKAAQACNDYLRMGAGRSLRKLWTKYVEMQDNTENEPPTASYDTLQAWSSRYDWPERAKAYDLEIEQEKNDRRREIMESGFALDYERVDTLKGLAHFLIEQVYEQGKDGAYHNIWLPDVKQIGNGEFAERVDIERFNSAILTQLRGVLDDLAKETGGRADKHEISGPGGGPISIREITVELPDEPVEN